MAAVITQSMGLYCHGSKDPRFAHIWIAGSEAISVLIAMYCLVQFYTQLKRTLAPHRPFFKMTCVKLVIFLTFWQDWLITFLSAKGGPVQPTARIAEPDFRIGIPAILACVEMAIFSILHIFAFSWQPYDLSYQTSLDRDSDGSDDGSDDASSKHQHGPLRNFMSALNPWDIIRFVARSMRWLFVGTRHRREEDDDHEKVDMRFDSKISSLLSDANLYAQQVWHREAFSFGSDRHSPAPKQDVFFVLTSDVWR